MNRFPSCGCLIVLAFFLTATGCTKQAERTAALQAKGVSFARSLDDEIQTARFEAYHPVDDDLAAVSGQTSLKELYAEAPAVTDKGFAEVAKLTNLKVLSVSKSGISGTGMTAIARLKDLQQLELPGSAKLDDAAIASLKGHSKLQFADFSGCPLTDASLETLLSIPTLTTIRLVGTKITDKGLEKLASAPRLTSLAVGSELISDAGVAALTGLSDLAELEVVSSKLTDNSMAVIAGLSKLRLLRLCDNPALTDTGICQLGSLPELTSLGVSRTAFTGSGCGAAGFPQLLGLEANGCQVTDAQIPDFAGIKNMTSLKLQDTSVTETGVRKTFAANHPTAVAFGKTE